ncbi:flavin reductase family protein [Micromonospora matsumotoense]|uniref:flavin reductase family protein n=1 Tax=Micromonospora matsumotoense TaxID=121616 RepID=UPI003F4E1B21
MHRSLREVMARFATGVTVVTVGGDNLHAMTANAVTSVSLDPPQILCCVAHSAVMHKAISAAEHFAVSVLGADQEHLARHFADRRRPLGAAQFETLPHRPGPASGAPLISGALAWLECRLFEAHDSGDHTIFVGSVIGAEIGHDGAGLLFFGGAFHRIGTGSAAVSTDNRSHTLQ